VIIWDDFRAVSVGEISLQSDVKAVRLRRETIVVALTNEVCLFGFDNRTLLKKYATTANVKGVVSVSPATNGAVMCCPGSQVGYVRVVRLLDKDEHFIKARDSHVTCLALNQDGTLLATASEKGTTIKVFHTNTKDDKVLRECRRGVTHYAEIYSMNFSQNSRFLCVVSSRSTVHVFNIGDSSCDEEDRPAEPRSYFSSVFSRVSGNADCESCFARYESALIPKTCAFGKDYRSIILLCSNGQYLKLKFDPDTGGEMEREKQETFTDAANS
jgi:WD40 repeat protein